MPFELIRNDITLMPTDAIVNAANHLLVPGGGVCGAIFQAAGREELEKACQELSPCETGSAVMTPGFHLPARYIIHAVGPRWQGGTEGERQLLESCYRKSLELALAADCRSVAFPLISSEIYGYPREEALEVAVSTIRRFLEDHEMMVYLVIFDRESLSAGLSRFRGLKSYIDDRYAALHQVRRERNEPLEFAGCESASMPMMAPAPAEPVKPKSKPKKLLHSVMPSFRPIDREQIFGSLQEPFSKMLFRLIDQRGLSDAAVYKKANLDRRLFSKLRKEDYNPGKSTVLALAVALELNLDQTKDLLARAGYALSPSNLSDVIIEFYINQGNYDIYEINEALFAFEQRLLGA